MDAHPPQVWGTVRKVRAVGSLLSVVPAFIMRQGKLGFSLVMRGEVCCLWGGSDVAQPMSDNPRAHPANQAALLHNRLAPEPTHQLIKPPAGAPAPISLAKVPQVEGVIRELRAGAHGKREGWGGWVEWEWGRGLASHG